MEGGCVLYSKKLILNCSLKHLVTKSSISGGLNNNQIKLKPAMDGSNLSCYPFSEEKVPTISTGFKIHHVRTSLVFVDQGYGACWTQSLLVPNCQIDEMQWPYALNYIHP